MMFPFNLFVQFPRKKNSTADPINNCLKFEYTFFNKQRSSHKKVLIYHSRNCLQTQNEQENVTKM